MLALGAPADVHCVRVTVFGAGRTAVRLLNVNPPASTVLSLNGLPVASDTFVGDAFASACASIGATEVATWVTDPVVAAVTAPPAPPANVTLSFHPNGRAGVGIDFDGGASDGATGLPPNTVSCDSTGCICVPGFADCNGSLADGCEANLQIDPNNCGTCANVCSGATPVCVASACVAALCDPATEVNFNGHCYYLDGSAGICDPGFSLASNATLTAILAANPNAWLGKTYRHTVSNNCCIETSDPVENFGMTFPGPCNSPGPFPAGQPGAGLANCTNAVNRATQQLTFCGSN
jgi:hypothetical protein